MTNPAEITGILRQATAGSADAMARLFPYVYEELRRVAANRLHRERADHTLQATDLVHEAYLKLIDQDRVDWQDRGHFFAVAATAMRRILVDHARSKQRLKRGGDVTILRLDELTGVAGATTNVDLLDLDSALSELEKTDATKARIVELRFFGGLTMKETAASVNVSLRSVERQWEFARAWLYKRMSGDDR